MKKFFKDYWLALLAILFIIFSFFSPYIFTFPAQNQRFDFTETGTIGDTINGIMGPFIAIAAALLTFAAFIVQKRANDIQIESIKKQVKKDEVASIESRILQLINLHRENINDLITINDKKNYNSGQDAISDCCRTVEYIIEYLETIPNEFSEKEKRIFSYLFLCHGVELANNEYFKNQTAFSLYTESEVIDKVYKHLYNNRAIKKYLLLSETGYINILSRYFRQLFQIIKYIDEQQILSKKEKYDYAKILRSSLTNKEQELLFNNILSPYGTPWVKRDNDGKSYVEKYKIFKNIPTYYIHGYSPLNFMADTFNYSESDLKDFFDTL